MFYIVSFISIKKLQQQKEQAIINKKKYLKYYHVLAIAH